MTLSDSFIESDSEFQTSFLNMETFRSMKLSCNFLQNRRSQWHIFILEGTFLAEYRNIVSVSQLIIFVVFVDKRCVYGIHSQAMYREGTIH